MIAFAAASRERTSSPSKRSRTTAKMTTMHPPAPIPWTRRSARRPAIDPANAAPIPAREKPAHEARRTGRRPRRSERGPSTSWESAKPARKRLIARPAVPTGARSDEAIDGRAGRTMSMESGGSATMAATRSV